MVIAGDFKNGVTFDMDGQVMQVIEFQHVKPGKGAAFVRTKLKNVITGAVTETTFNPTDKFQDARIDRREMQYLYNDGDLYYFMDTDTYEQLPIGADNPQNKALMGALQMLNPQMPDLFEMAGDKNLISLGLEGKAKMAVGVNLGVMWDINEQWSLGFTYRSKLKMKVDSGSIDLRMIDNTQIAQVIGQLLPQLGLDPAKLTSAVVKTELPLPASLTWGVSFRPVPKWEFAVDLQYVLWSAYDKLDVKILEPSSNTPVLNIPVSDKKYSNTLAFRFGGQYHALDWLTARMGMYVDESPVRSDYLNPETPSMTKLAYTAGVTFRPIKWMNIDIAYGYVNSADPERTGSYPYTNSVLGIVNEKLAAAGVPESQFTNPVTDFSGNYTARAHTFSIGVGFSF